MHYILPPVVAIESWDALPIRAPFQRRKIRLLCFTLTDKKPILESDFIMIHFRIRPCITNTFSLDRNCVTHKCPWLFCSAVTLRVRHFYQQIGAILLCNDWNNSAVKVMWNSPDLLSNDLLKWRTCWGEWCWWSSKAACFLLLIVFFSGVRASTKFTSKDDLKTWKRTLIIVVILEMIERQHSSLKVTRIKSDDKRKCAKHLHKWLGGMINALIECFKLNFQIASFHRHMHCIVRCALLPPKISYHNNPVKVWFTYIDFNVT